MATIEFYNGYTNEVMSEAEVKSLKIAKLTVKDDSVIGGKLAVESMNVYAHTLDMDCKCYQCEERTLFSIARIIKLTWDKVWFGAVPYLQSMGQCESVDSVYGCEDGKTQVIYFLSNAAQYKGTIAQHIKKELKYYTGLK